MMKPKKKPRVGDGPSRLTLFSSWIALAVRHDGTLADLAASGRKSRLQKFTTGRDRSQARAESAYNQGNNRGSWPVGHALMTANRLIELMNRDPFEPLELHLSDGERIQVEYPYEISTRPNCPTCTVYKDDDRMRVIALRNITEVITARNCE
jgi:hypothetical protein